MTGTLAYQLRCGHCGSRDIGPHVCDVPTTKRPEPDCRTCIWSHTTDTLRCAHGNCINGDRYQPLPPVRLYRSKT